MNADQLDALLDVLTAAPDLPGAACVGMWEAFDPREQGESAEDADYRHRTALHLCRTCTALASCGEWFDNLPPTRRPAGVVAGQTWPPPQRPVGRPRKEAS